MVEEQTVAKTQEQLLAELQEALNKGDFRAVAKVSKEIASMQADAEKAERDIKLAALVKITVKVKDAIDKIVQKFYDSGELDEADGVWYTKSFEDNTVSCRLLKNAPKTGGTGTHAGTGKKFPSTQELLAEHGAEVVNEETGQTWQQLYDEAKGDGNKVYQVRIKLAKKLGIA